MIDITHYHSKHFEDRKNGAKAEYIIIHCTEVADAEEAHKHYTGEILDEDAGRISPHYMIDETGKVYQYVDEDKRAWHAGLSEWRGINDMNSASIGIELSNLGRKGDYPDYPEVQMAALIELCQGIMERHNIPPENVLGHSDISVGRRYDPDHHFNWERCAGSGVGIWPKFIEVEDIKAAKTYSENPDIYQVYLVEYGYSAKAKFEDNLEAFHRHFLPEVFELSDEKAARKIQPEGAQRLACLLRLRKAAKA